MPTSFADLEEKLSFVAGLTPLVQIDVMDGRLTSKKTWPYIFTELDKNFGSILREEEGFPFWNDVDFEVDLMVKEPEKIWRDWEAFASYAFNKSHSTCYAWVAYQTAFLKANYPAEYMASVLSNNMNDIKQVSFFMEECRRMGLPVLGPDINESNYTFTVNKAGAVRFGLGAIKGLGSAPVDAFVEERLANGPFISIFDLTKRSNLRICNKRAIESLVYAGALDSFRGIHRAQYFAEDQNGRSFIDNAIRF